MKTIVYEIEKASRVKLANSCYLNGEKCNRDNCMVREFLPDNTGLIKYELSVDNYRYEATNVTLQELRSIKFDLCTLLQFKVHELADKIGYTEKLNWCLTLISSVRNINTDYYYRRDTIWMVRQPETIKRVFQPTQKDFEQMVKVALGRRQYKCYKLSLSYTKKNLNGTPLFSDTCSAIRRMFG